jgi:hypothetical protein
MPGRFYFPAAEYANFGTKTRHRYANLTGLLQMFYLLFSPFALFTPFTTQFNTKILPILSNKALRTHKLDVQLVIVRT